jgi:hypothetical protein
MSAVKQKAQEIIARLPEDATWQDLIDTLQVRQRIEEGLEELDQRRVTPHERVRERFLGRETTAEVLERLRRLRQSLGSMQDSAEIVRRDRDLP